ncbi:MAG: PAS domain-containing protein, partial [Verrucomicrobia bacterium]|nr:PAS domain-containing protein [Verrucomicrobiota bacterium]
MNAALESQGAGTYDEEYRILRPNGEIRWIRDRAFPILTAQQKLHKIAGIAEDITSRKIADEQQKTLVSERTEKLAWTNLALESEIAERRKAETQLREANQRLQKAWQELHATQQKLIQQERLRALEDMAEGVVHRFHDTLIPFFGYPELLLERPALLEDRAVALEYLRSLHTAAKDATATLDQLQEFCRQRNETETFEPLDLLAALTEAIAKTQPRWHDEGLAQGRHVTVEKEFQPVPKIAGHAGEIREAVTNLIFNAIDALPQGGRIVVRAHPHGQNAVLEVQDNGIGMSDE